MMTNKKYTEFLLQEVRGILSERNQLAVAEAEERIENIEEELDPEQAKAKEEVKNMDEKEIQVLRDELTETKAKLESTVAKLDEKVGELQAQVSQTEAVTTEKVAIEETVKELQTYKETIEAMKEEQDKRVATLAARKQKVEEAELDIDLESDDNWLAMSDEVFEFTLNKMSEMKKEGASASASITVPPIKSDSSDEEGTATDRLRKGLQEHKEEK